MAMNASEAASARDHVFVDVRERYEWEAGHVRGSLHIPIGQIQRRFEELSREHPIVVVCQVGQRSALVADFLCAQGYVAHNLDGDYRSGRQGLPLSAVDDRETSSTDGARPGRPAPRRDARDLSRAVQALAVGRDLQDHPIGLDLES